jgi:acetyl-CoA acetyltransferase
MSTSSRNPMKDQVAFAGAATTGFSAHNTDRTPLSLAAEACSKLLRECGLKASDIDGICGPSSVSAGDLQNTLGIPELTWWSNPPIPFVNQVIQAASAVHAGICDTVLVYHVPYRHAFFTASALRDPFRRVMPAIAPGGNPDTMWGPIGYTAWASRYIHEYNVPKERFGLVAINDRSNAQDNPGAAMREPMTMDDYMSARMVRWPLCLLDMDVPVDGADAFIITTTERARDLPFSPVMINAAVLGMVDANVEDQTVSLEHHGHHVVAKALKAKSDFWIDDIDVYFPYDGFTIITLNWLENIGFCGRGEAGDFLAANWDAEKNRILINGRIPVNPHGGALSEGGSQGSGHIREAIHQLQGRAGVRQVANARRTLVTAGGFFYNAQGLALHRD